MQVVTLATCDDCCEPEEVQDTTSDLDVPSQLELVCRPAGQVEHCLHVTVSAVPRPSQVPAMKKPEPHDDLQGAQVMSESVLPWSHVPLMYWP